jgi:hypothetical protein
VAARFKFLRTDHNVRISSNKRQEFVLEETLINQKHSNIHMEGLIKKMRLGSSCGKKEQSYYMSHRISKDRLYSSQLLNYLEELCIIIMDQSAIM